MRNTGALRVHYDDLPISDYLLRTNQLYRTKSLFTIYNYRSGTVKLHSYIGLSRGIVSRCHVISSQIVLFIGCSLW